MSDLLRDFHVLLDGESFTQGTGFRLSGRVDLNLYPDLFILQCRNLQKEGIYQLQNARQISVVSNGSRLASGQTSGLPNGSCLASGTISDVYTQTVPEGTVTVAAFSLGLNLWNAEVSVSCPAGTSISDDVRTILEASGTGIRCRCAAGLTSVKPPKLSRRLCLIATASAPTMFQPFTQAALRLVPVAS